MIKKHKILGLAKEMGLSPSIIEKDYVIGWVLAGINQHPAISKDWVFKGGTCLKKCYFETYRWSEDLDFTLLNTKQIDQDFLLRTFVEISNWVYENSGIEIATKRLDFELYTNPRGIIACTGSLYYRGPISPSSDKAIPRLKLDLTSDEVIVDEPKYIQVRHDYTDHPVNGIKILGYSYLEVFAEKIRALKERTRPRDLYDVIHFYRRPESLSLAKKVKALLQKKCAFKNVEFPTLVDLEKHKETCSLGWEQQLLHQLPSLPPFDSFWDELPNFFTWLNNINIKTELTPIPLKDGETVISLRDCEVLLPQVKSKLETIQFAAANHQCVEIYYRDGYIKGIAEIVRYAFEPYSLRKTTKGCIVLCLVECNDPHSNVIRLDANTINGAHLPVTSHVNKTFRPRYEVEFLPEVVTN